MNIKSYGIGQPWVLIHTRWSELVYTG